MPNGETSFPGGSKARVNRAGDAVREDRATADDLNAINIWRAGHGPVIKNFQAILRTRTRNSEIVVAQRHKRRRTNFDKLKRYPKMQLSWMDDVAGCRLIFPSIADLMAFRANLHKAHFHHILKNEKKKYDYITTPRSSGYRGIHDIYSYNVNSIKTNT